MANFLEDEFGIYAGSMPTPHRNTPNLTDGKSDLTAEHATAQPKSAERESKKCV